MSNEEPKKKKRKHGGITILVVTAGLLFYALAIIWYDGVNLKPAEIEKMDPYNAPEEIQWGIHRLISEGYNGALYLVLPKEAAATLAQSWMLATHVESIVKLQVHGVIADLYPQRSFTVIRYSNLKDMLLSFSLTGGMRNGASSAVLLKESEYRFNSKMVFSIIYALLFIFLVKKLGKPKDS